MNATRRLTGLAALLALCLVLGSASSAYAQAAAAGSQDPGAKQPYTMAEYNSEQACASDKVPASQNKCLDDFVSKYPNSNLLIYVYPMYYQAYYQLKNWPKVIENADKVVSLGEKVGANDRYNALYVRAFAYNSLSPADQTAQAKTAITGASAALKLQPDLKKPDQIDEKAFEEEKKKGAIVLNGTAAQAAFLTKDYPTAITYYKAVLALNPDEPITNYRLGQAYMASTPPQAMDGVWYIARAATSKAATQEQVTKVKPY